MVGVAVPRQPPAASRWHAAGVALIIAAMVFLGASVLTSPGTRTQLPQDVRPLWIWLTVLLAAGADDPGVVVPEDLWILMGISTTSLVGTPLVSSRKKSKTPTDEEAAIAMNTLADQGRDARALSTSGQLIGNRTMGEARWSDLFEAEVLATYAALVASALKSASVIEKLPVIPESMVALLGISHAGYLTAKVLPEPE
jgi:hypothetical protein